MSKKLDAILVLVAFTCILNIFQSCEEKEQPKAPTVKLDFPSSLNISHSGYIRS